MIAVLVSRSGELPAGAPETVAEAGGEAVVVGEGTAVAAGSLAGVARRCRVAETGPFAPARLAVLLAPVLSGEDAVLLPSSPDGRDLAPRLAHALRRPLYAGAQRVGAARVELVREGGLVLELHVPDGPFVATLAPGCRSVERVLAGTPVLEELEVGAGAEGVVADAEVVEVLPADPATVELEEAERILAGGAGLGGAESFALLREVSTALGAAVGGTRVVTDAGLLERERQIGTTGARVAPRCYVAFGVSGASQHLGGVVDPAHVVAVNLDPSCPMMALADLALVSDAPALLRALAELLGAGDG